MPDFAEVFVALGVVFAIGDMLVRPYITNKPKRVTDAIDELQGICEARCVQGLAKGQTQRPLGALVKCATVNRGALGDPLGRRVVADLRWVAQCLAMVKPRVVAAMVMLTYCCSRTVLVKSLMELSRPRLGLYYLTCGMESMRCLGIRE
eukprot:5245913-Amphidinium_carterae.1